MNDEDNIEEMPLEFSKGISYKIKPDNVYTIIRQEFRGKTFYKIPVNKRGLDGTSQTALKPVKFHRGVQLKDRTKIKIIHGFEDFYFHNKNAYAPIFYIVVTEFEIVEQSPEELSEAYLEYNKTVEEDYDGIYDFPFI